MSIDVGQEALDACTLNNIMNAVQIAILISLLKWVRSDNQTDEKPRK